MQVPLATYRLQLNRHFTLEESRALLGYLRELGISDVYASPLFLARPESLHGYDICDFERINPAVGTLKGLERLGAELRESGMGLLLDIVPNHMGAHPSNCWWQDVLAHGRNSKFATFFDIDWNSSTPGLEGRVLLPVLGDAYGRVLERGELEIKVEKGEAYLAYFDHRFPLSPESKERFGLDHGRSEEERGASARAFNAQSEGKNRERLHELIQMQHYRLCYWRVGPYEINYRRFFDVNELVSVRVEDPGVFRATHRLILELLKGGIVAGLRVDHPDGLRDPEGYFAELQRTAGTPFYVVAEKILSDDERLPENWQVEGTTGYDYLNYLNGVFVRRDNEAAFTRIYERFTGNGEDYPTVAFRSKRDVLEKLFVAEVNALTRRLKRIAAQTVVGADLIEPDLRTAIVELIAAFPVYRTYLADRAEGISKADRGAIEKALAGATARTTLREKDCLEFLADILSLDLIPQLTEKAAREAREFVQRFQQVSGPATAKGLEDTAFYRYTRFVSLNEVGGNPGRFGVTLEEFHDFNEYQQEHWPHSLLTTSTHDTKRGEDVRARLNVLSEMPAEWEETVRRWHEENSGPDGNDRPTLNDEYLIYQTVAGTWSPGFDRAEYLQRLQAYMLKAVREAKGPTSWIDRNDQYERALAKFLERLLASEKFLTSMAGVAEQLAFFGMFNSLAQVVLKTCSPGVPDFYQGSELWDLTLVDPDNRRPVDFPLRRTLLAKMEGTQPERFLEERQSGSAKMFVMRTLLEARRKYRESFEGAYKAVTASGEKKEHVIAFARSSGRSCIVVAVPRFVRTLTGGRMEYPGREAWGDTALAWTGAKRFLNLLTNEECPTLKAGDLFRRFPAAVLLTLD